MDKRKLKIYFQTKTVFGRFSTKGITVLWGLLNNSLQLCDGAITNKNLKVPEKPKLKCMGFTYNGAKLFNMLPPQMSETKDPNNFKTMMKNWIWDNIPSY